MKAIIRNEVSRFGLIAAGIQIAYLLYGYLIDDSLLVSMWMGIVLFFITLGVLIAAPVMVRKRAGGFISFRQAFTSFVLTYIVYGLVSTAFSVLLFDVVDREFAAQLQEKSMEKTALILESFNVPEEQIAEGLEKSAGENQFSAYKQISSFFWSLLMYAVIGLLVAAAVKKSRPYEDGTGETALDEGVTNDQ